MEGIMSSQWQQDSENLKSYVRQLGDQAIPWFLLLLSELPEGQTSRLCSISLYEFIVREHGKSIIPHISKIMENVLKALSSSAPLWALQQACAGLVSALARYTIDLSTFEGQRDRIIRDLSKPLVQVLSGTAETLSEGAAMCLQALVESEAWKLAPKDVVSEVCLILTTALQEKETQTASHLKLVCSLANSNSLTLEVYGRLLLKSTHQILEIEADHPNSQRHWYAIQMVYSLLKYVHVYYIISEIPKTIQILERYSSEGILYVRNAVSKALHIAKFIAVEFVKGYLIYSGSSSDDEIPLEGWKSWRSSIGGSVDVLNNTEMDSYIYPPVSSLQSLNAKCQTPLKLGSDAMAKRLPHSHAEQGPQSPSMDNVALPEKEGGSPCSTLTQVDESLTPNDGQQRVDKRTSHQISGGRVKDGECSGNMPRESTVFENKGSGKGMVGGTDGEATAQYKNDSTPGENFLLGHLEQDRSDNFDEHGGGGDALLSQKEDCERKPPYREAGNEEATPCTSSASMEKAAFTSQESGSRMKFDDASTSCNLDGSLTQQLLDDQTSGKNEFTKTQCTDFTGVDHETSSEGEGRMNCNPISDNEMTVEEHGQGAVALKGRILLDNPDGVLEESSDRSISKQRDPQECSSVSNSVHGSGSVSLASLSTTFFETTDSQEHLQSTALPQLDNGSPRINDGENKRPMTDSESVEDVTMSKTNAFYRAWTKVTSSMKTILKGCVCAVLVVHASMVAVKFYRMDKEYHVLFPT